MSESRDPLLEAVAEAARAERARLPSDAELEALEALAAGELDDEAQAALTGAAALDAVRLHVPLDAAFRDGVANSALAALRGEAPAEPERPVVLPLRRDAAPVRRRWPLAALGLAAAAAVLLLVNQGPSGPAGPAGPLYRLELHGGEQSLRGEPTATEAEVRRVGPGARLELVVRPEVAAPRAPRLSAWLLRDGGLRPWNVTPEVAPTGAVRIAGTFETLGLGAFGEGPTEVVLALADDEPPSQARAEAALGGASNGVSLLRAPLDLRGSSETVRPLREPL